VNNDDLNTTNCSVLQYTVASILTSGTKVIV